MVEQFLKFIRDENLFHSSERILLAVSGGADSMLMLHLFANAGFSVGVAHCNFGLRGAESDGDEQFVAQYCDQNRLQFLVRRFNTREYALQEGISIEMAARELRYKWFSQLLRLHGFACLATAHHQDDAIETFLINLSRGSGIKGLSGIRPKSGQIIRPMLFARREEIQAYCSKMKIEHRTDASNQDTTYKRNLIRHQILPLLEQVNPAFRKNTLKTIANLHETGLLFQQRMAEIKAQVFSEDDQGAIIHIGKLLNLAPLRTILFELVRQFGFGSEQMDDMIDALEKDSGRKFLSKTHRLIKDRDFLLISPLNQSNDQVFYVSDDQAKMEKPIHLTFEKTERTADFRFSTHQHAADLDYDKLAFPLILRHWREGEYFQPLGMNGLKKLSDFFIDEKYSIPEKESVWILSSGNQPVWVVGKRIDERYKITSNTRKVFRIRFMP